VPLTKGLGAPLRQLFGRWTEALRPVEKTRLQGSRAAAIDSFEAQPTLSPLSPPRPLREQAVRFELLANDGRYCDNRVTATAPGLTRGLSALPETRPMTWGVVPQQDGADWRLFAPKDSAEAARLLEQLSVGVRDPKTGKAVAGYVLPLHFEEAATLGKRLKKLRVISDGRVYPSASPRSLFVGTAPKDAPANFPGVEAYSIKTHLSHETYERIGGLGGSREINFNDALMAVVIDHVLHALAPRMSPLIELQSEGCAVAARLGKGDDAVEVGAIFRKLSDGPVVPGFAMYSPTLEALPHVPTAAEKPRILAADALRFAMQKNPGTTREQAFLKLFVDPLFEVFYSMAKEGISMELHPQNFLLRFDEQTGWVKKVVLRDLHGVGYSQRFREERGLDDVFSLQALGPAFPDLTQADLDAFFERNGELRERYTVPKMFESTLDFFLAMFHYHLLDSLLEDGTFNRSEVDALIQGIRDRSDFFAERYDFDASELRPARRGRASSFWVAQEEGIRGKTLFRNPPPRRFLESLFG
jgi:hypothetical protein